MRKIVIDDSRDFKGAWIPAEIYTISELSWTEKILLIEIINLNKLGKCYAHNQHFANMLGVSTRQVSKMVSKLTDLGYVKCEIVRDAITKEVKERIITPMEQKFVRGIEQNVDRGIEQKFQEKNTLPKESTMKKNGIVRDFSRQTLFDKYGIPKEINIAGEEELIDGVQYFIDRYIEWSEIDHRQYTEDQWTKYITNVSNGFLFADEELTEERMREVVDYWFDRKKVTGTMEFAQFAQPNMIQGALEVIAGKVRYRTVLNTNRELQFV